MKKVIHESSKIIAGGPYSLAVEAGGLIFISGQLAIDPQTGLAVAELQPATRQALLNIKNILSDIGLGMENVVRTTIYLVQGTDFAAANEIYKEFFLKDPPARSTVFVSALPKSSLIEIDAIAVR